MARAGRVEGSRWLLAIPWAETQGRGPRPSRGSRLTRDACMVEARRDSPEATAGRVRPLERVVRPPDVRRAGEVEAMRRMQLLVQRQANATGRRDAGWLRGAPTQRPTLVPPGQCCATTSCPGRGFRYISESATVGELHQDRGIVPMPSMLVAGVEADGGRPPAPTAPRAATRKGRFHSSRRWCRRLGTVFSDALSDTGLGGPKPTRQINSETPLAAAWP